MLNLDIYVSVILIGKISKILAILVLSWLLRQIYVCEANVDQIAYVDTLNVIVFLTAY